MFCGSSYSLSGDLLPPSGRNRPSTARTARLPGWAVMTFAVIGPVAKGKSCSLGAAHRPCCPATHEPALQTFLYLRRNCTDPNPLDRHCIPISIIDMTSLPHSLHQSLHLIFPAECLVLSWRGRLA